MPIHVNLLAEMQEADELRRRDPIKRAIFGGISLMAVALMWDALVEVKVLLAEAQLTGVQQAIDAKTSAYQHAAVDLKSIAAGKNKLNQLDKLQTARFLQGSLLDVLQHSVVDGVQLTRMRVTQSYASVQRTTPDGGSVSSFVNEDITLHLDAQDSSANPGDMVNTFKETLNEQPYFQAMLGKTNELELTGPPSVLQTDAGKPYVTFALECNFLSHTR